ncbi:anaphase-promoting complex subunit 5 [Prorops nasuta]|uniref:anaphase-promoting complex subunit 5 n=1 Tax=Prorops nasuta TaxID=863751 RepID=UPI0034CD8F62
MSKDLLHIEGITKKIQKEILTPYKIAVVLLIKEYCHETSKTVVEKRDFCLASLKLIQSPDMELNGLLNVLYSHEFVLHRYAHQLELELNEICAKGVEEFLDLFDGLGWLMKPSLDHSLSAPILNKTSVLGLYVRRIIIFFEKLVFDQVVILYSALQKYVDKNYSAPETSKNLIKVKKPDNYSYKSISIWGGRQAELLIAQQAHALQTDEHKAMSPVKLQTLIHGFISSSPYYAEAHYLSYLNCLRVNEYCGALDSLYHCFDTLIPLENRNGSEDRTRTFRYAALNLAVLHAQFNHKVVAMAALKEAIMMAQEAGDNVCLQLAHAWMFYLTNKQKGPLIERSVGKSSVLGITHTTGLALIAFAHHCALEGKSPSTVFEALLKSDVLNCEHSMIDLVSMTYAEKSALWAYYGKTELSSISAQLLLLYNTGDKKQHMFNGPSTCQALINIADILVDFGEYDLVDVVLGHAKERFPNEPCNKIWMLSEQLYIFNQMMMHEDWSQAEAIALNISSLDPLECKFRQAEVLLDKGDYLKSQKLVNDFEKTINLTPRNRVRAMILSSEIMYMSLLPEKGVIGNNCIILLNSALELASRFYLSYYSALIKMHLANVQLIMGLPVLAMNLIEESIVHILAHGGCYDQGRALVLYAKCLVVTAPKDNCEERKDIILDAIKALKKAKSHFVKIEAYGKLRSILCLEAVFYNEIDFKTERNQCAFEFRQIDEQFTTKLCSLSLC